MKNKNISIGFSVIISSQRSLDYYTNLLQSMLTNGCSVIEIHLPNHDGFERSEEILHLIKAFSYRSIHTSNLYSEAKNHKEAHYYSDLLNAIEGHAITVHPHTMTEWQWLNRYFGNKVSFENMDWRKPFGKTPEDMQKVFADAQDCRWTFDLNHVYSNDSSMVLAKEFSKQFDNLGHYHVSGFMGEDLPHTTLHSTKQDSIVQPVNIDYPIVLESYGLDDIDSFEDELIYVKSILS